MSRLSLRNAGTTLALVGATHFLTPSLYEPVTTTAFPVNTRAWVYRNGTTEIALGLALRSKRLRRTGITGIFAYLLWLGANAIKSR